MSGKNDGDLLQKARKLSRENKEIRRQLQDASNYIDSMKAKDIDALVISSSKHIKVFTEKTADQVYRLFVENMPEGAVTLSSNGTILYCNLNFAAMVELPMQKVIGSKFKKFIDFSKDDFDALLKTGPVTAIKEEVFLQVNGHKTIPVLISVNALRLDEETVLSIILTDLSVLYRNQEELRERTMELEEKNIELENVNKDLNTFTYLSSHDLQEPLRKIQSFVTCILLEEEKNLSESGKGYFQRLKLTAKRMQELISDLLAYSRAKSKEHNFEKTDLNVLVEEAKRDFDDIIHNVKATIEVSELCDVNVIPSQFRQVIHNFISNSLKFRLPEAAPRIVIKSTVVPGSDLNNDKLLPVMDYCHISYSDNGIGFDPRYNELIFDVFQRLHSQEEYSGTGMGLAICKRIIENHNGIVTASGSLNNGARFDIYIPVH